ncbi:4'-phosphopantetheinyl transferase family protein [Vibrio cholerae]
MLLPIVSSRKLMSHLVLEKEKPFVDFIDSFQIHEFAEYHPDIRGYTCQYKVEKFCGDIYEKLPFDEPEHIRNAVIKRRAEFLAGRIAAMVALESLAAREVRVAIGPHRNPIWPEGYLGSITHTSTNAIAVVAPKWSVTYLGIDHETMIPINVATRIAPQILTCEEMVLYHQLSIGFDQFCTIVFSIKESVFKAVYPKVERYLDFSEARVTDICFEKREFRAELCSGQWGGDLKKGKVLKGHFRVADGYVSTMVCTN